MEQNLSKKDKAALRQLIEKGVQAEYSNALNELDALIGPWKQGNKDNRETYQAVYESLHKNNKSIARRYDGISGSHYVTKVIEIYLDGQITREDLMILSEDVQQEIVRVGQIRSL